jgi:YidC/Oxa1 family membrane protein insertase
MIYAVALMAAVYFVWSSWFAPKPTKSAAKAAATASAPAEATATAEAGSAPTVASVGNAPSDVVVPNEGKTWTGDGWTSELHARNGSLRSLTLNDYTDAATVTPWWDWLVARVMGRTQEGWSPNSGGGDPHRLLTEEGALTLAGGGALDDDGAGVQDGAPAYLITADGDALVATRTRADGLRIQKRYAPGPHPFTVDVTVSFQNNGTAPINGLWVGMADRLGGADGRFSNAVRPVAYADETVEHTLSLEDTLGDKKVDHEGPVTWFGLSDRFFMAVLAPDEPVASVVVNDLPGGRIGTFWVDPTVLPPGQSRSQHFTSFVGPKNLDLMKPVGHDLESSVELGWFAFFARPLLFLLKIFHMGVGNWGVSIILLTLLIKLVFFPVTQKSFASSAKMQALQPALTELREKFKDSPELQGQETLKLYQKHGVNPVGGCLPQLLTIPVWIALYNVLLHSVELYDSRFAYIKDLTAPDPFGVLPTVYAGLMFVQQRSMPMTGMDESQQKMMRMMPLIFAFFMYTFPSGLVLYSSINMLLTIAQQKLITRTNPGPGLPSPV